MRRGNFTIARCEHCGLRFLDPQPSAEAVQAYYEHEYFSSGESLGRGYDAYLEEAENHRATFRDRLRRLPKPVEHRRLLDVGAATGFFVEQARLAGWDAEGLEPSEWAASYARERLGLPVRRATLEDARLPGMIFDALTLWEVIEHVPDPRALLVESARVLRPGGVLALSTPDAGSMVARVFGSHWLGWRKLPEHLYFFDRATLVRLLQSVGFDVIWYRYVSITVTAGFAAQRLGALLGMPFLGHVPRLIAKRALPVNPLYDLMVVARRCA
jgi:2-polyprenyl-3-methyl-5-hydroxy-6-metoxy-1,4-benzoquinol methylase